MSTEPQPHLVNHNNNNPNSAEQCLHEASILSVHTIRTKRDRAIHTALAQKQYMICE